MSPRSEEFLTAARRRLAAAVAATHDDPSAALSLAYYAMLYAARGALSERDTYAKTHRGTWHKLRVAFVETGAIDPDLVTAAQRVQPEREQADYEAWPAAREDAERVIELASAFIAAIETALG